MDKQDGDLSSFLSLYHIPFLTPQRSLHAIRMAGTLAVTCSQGLKFKRPVFPHVFFQQLVVNTVVSQVPPCSVLLSAVSVIHSQLWSENTKWKIPEISTSYVLNCCSE